MGSSAEDLWRAPFRGNNPITAAVTIPGSKSATNRALILAALAKSPSTLRKPLHSRDSALMIAGLKAIGCGITEESNGDLIVTPGKFFGPASVDVGNAGTVMRFLPPVAALANGLVHFDGDARSHERPVGPVISALEELGVTIEHGNRYSLPLTINGSGKINGGTLEIDASASSQFISALLLIGPETQTGITIKDIGVSLPSLPHIEMTIEMLKKFGAQVSSSVNESGKRKWRVEPGDLIGQDLVIEPDLSNAAPFMAAAMISGGDVVITDWPKSTAQPGDQLRNIFTKMGAKIEFVGNDLKISGTGKIHGVDIDLHDVGELTPSIAAVAALADSPSSLRGIGHLRLHETDRLAALATELNALGGDVDEEESALHISPSPLHSGIFHTYDDHRLATAGAMIGLAIDGIAVENISTTQKTLPDFPGTWHAMLSSKSFGSL
ncbi:MAG: 3-phosphoshikimate 1-carboxyvinyltransferase [Actinobacteria bacterium]|nr:3-phosphoshikimate 1-carboxyvinyltransferase [Actinomycetota bacterium]MSZ01876.1 3-phosphoshikimate 1-carboxyvinyltransferase [Actinomycetota bacterium]